MVNKLAIFMQLLTLLILDDYFTAIWILLFFNKVANHSSENFNYHLPLYLKIYLIYYIPNGTSYS